MTRLKGLYFGGLTLLVFLCPKHCAHMQVSSILVCVYVCVLCVTAGVSKR